MRGAIARSCSWISSVSTIGSVSISFDFEKIMTIENRLAAGIRLALVGSLASVMFGAHAQNSTRICVETVVVSASTRAFAGDAR